MPGGNTRRYALTQGETMQDKVRERIAGYLGIAQRAGKIAAGDAAAADALVRKKAFLLVLAEDAAAQVKAELTELAGDQLPVLYWPDKVELGRIVGKSRRGAIAVLDEGFARAIKRVLVEESEPSA